MPVSSAARLTRLSFSSGQSRGDFQERLGRKFGEAADGLKQNALNCLHSAFARPEASRPLAMSILVELYLSGAAFASAIGNRLIA